MTFLGFRIFIKSFTRTFHQAKTFFVKYETTTSITEIL